ncbi:MAG: inositol monophosphatase family protein [Verrucomicrobiota bacterium]
MNLSSEQLTELTAIASYAAERAGALIREYANREIEIFRKDAGDSLATQVVTEVDEKAQSIILDELEQSIFKYDLALLTEESEDDGSRHQKDYFWCIDPMDGTLPFTRRKPGYAVSIGLVGLDGTPSVGVIFDPVENCMYTAAVGLGARINGKPWRLLNQKPRASACLRFFCDCTFEDDPDREMMTARMLKFATDQGYASGEVILGGGAVLNALQVLLNSPAVYFKRPKPKTGGGCSWDFAASSCFFTDAGGYVSDFWGKRLELNDAKHQYFNHCGVCFSTDALLVASIAEYFGEIE